MNVRNLKGSKLLGGVKKKRSHRVRSFLFALQSKQTCDIMIKISSAYRLSVAKLVVDGEKQPEWLFFSVKGTKQEFLKQNYFARKNSMRLPCRPRYVRTSSGV